MNSLSFLIYLSGVTGSMSGFLTFLASVFAIMAIISAVVWVIMHDQTDQYGNMVNDKSLVYRNDMRKHSWRWFWVFMMLCVFSGSMRALTPSRQTVLLIAASEMGEKALNHPRVQTVMDPGIELLTTWMAKETQDLKKHLAPAAKP